MELLPDYYRRKREAERLVSVKETLVKDCPKCGGGGIIHNAPKFKKGMTLLDMENSIEDNHEKCSCFKKYKRIERLLISGIRREFWGCEKWGLLESTKNTGNWKFIKTYINNLVVARARGIGFVLYGKQGTGKTSAGMLILTKALRKGYTAHYLYMRDLLNELRILTTADKTYDLEETKGYIEEVVDADFVFIDEVGKAKVSDFTKQEYEGFIRKRVANGLPTVLATNLSKEKIIKIYGESTEDLLWGSMKELEFMGGSYRRKRKAQKVDNFFNKKKRRRHEKV